MAVFARKFGWVLVFTVLMLFLFPLQFGSFTQTHGPTTALRALTAAQALFATMAFSVSLTISLIVLRRLSRSEIFAPVSTSRSSSFQLRC